MCLSTVWHLFFHYFEWCEGTVGVFTLKDVTRTCLRATFDIRSRVSVHYLDLTVTPWRPHTKCSIKTCSHTALACLYALFLLTKTYLHVFFDIWGPLSVSPTLLLLFLELMSPRNFWHIRQRLCAIAWLDQHVCTQAYRLVVGQSPWARAWIAQPIGCTTCS